MAQIVAAELAQEDTGRAEQPGLGDLASGRPARGAVGRDLAVLPRPPERTGDGRGAAEETAGGRQHPRLVEDRRSVGAVVIPPCKELPGPIDRRSEHLEPGRSELGGSFAGEGEILR